MSTNLILKITKNRKSTKQRYSNNNHDRKLLLPLFALKGKPEEHNPHTKSHTNNPLHNVSDKVKEKKNQTCICLEDFFFIGTSSTL